MKVCSRSTRSEAFVSSPIIVGQRPEAPLAGLPLAPAGSFVSSPIIVGQRPEAPLAGLPLAPAGAFISSPIVVGQRPRAPLNVEPVYPLGSFISSPIIVGQRPRAPQNVEPIAPSGAFSRPVITISKQQEAPQGISPKIYTFIVASPPVVPYWMQWAAGGPPPFWENQEEILDYTPDGTFNLHERAIAEKRLKQIFEDALDEDHPLFFTEQVFNVRNEIYPKSSNQVGGNRVEGKVSRQARSAFRGDRPVTLVQQNINIKNQIVEKNSIFVETAKFVGAVVLATVIAVHIIPPRIVYKKTPRNRHGKRLRG